MQASPNNMNVFGFRIGVGLASQLSQGNLSMALAIQENIVWFARLSSAWVV
jgi:hypothetical protein